LLIDGIAPWPRFGIVLGARQMGNMRFRRTKMPIVDTEAPQKVCEDSAFSEFAT
jgi:hypothetical protein